MSTYFFCGIGGSGMNPLAQVLVNNGHTVKGSDRAYDNKQSLAKFSKLQALGIQIYKQDGSGLKDTDFLVVSSAIEDTIPDVKAALDANIPIIKRSELLAEIFNKSTLGVAIGGTSGKSTTTGILSHILCVLNKMPTTINGAIMKNATANSSNDFGLGNVTVGTGPCVIEADESDGSIAFYNPAVSVLTNVSEDHKTFDELYQLFGNFIKKPEIGCVLNADCIHTKRIASQAKNAFTFSTTGADATLCAANITPTAQGVNFDIKGTTYKLSVAGKHNVENVLAATLAAMHLGCNAHEALTAAQSFNGVGRRMDTLGTTNSGITVIDDFGHNPDKITATLNTLQQYNGRIIVMFQPHGFAPTLQMKDGYIKSFVSGMKDEDILIIPEIYYAGGTVQRTISSEDLTNAINANGKNAIFCADRQTVELQILKLAKPGDRVVIMGARDDTLTEFGYKLLKELTEQTR